MPDVIPQSKLPRSYSLVSLGVLGLAALVSVLVAWGALWAVERNSRTAVEHALMIQGLDWARVDTNGLQVFLSGTAPSEPDRFSALTAAGHEVDGARVIDLMEVPDPAAITPPRFSIELLRNQSGISLIGLVPASTDRAALAGDMQRIDPIRPVADLLETADYPQPEGWQGAVRFTTYAAGLLPRAKISMDADHVAVEAIADSPEEKADWERKLRARAPGGVRIALDISSPRPVISPFTLRFISDEAGARFDACTAHTQAGRNVIVSAGIAAGVKGAVDCPIALGVPSPDWPDAVSRAIRAVREMGGGALTFSDADISLIAPEGTSQDTYDRVIGELEADLPEVFALHGVLPEPEDSTAATAGPPEFTATLGEGGAVQLRGRVANQQQRTIVESYARARFGTTKVYAPLNVDPGLPEGWSVRTLAGLEALDLLADGRVVIRPALVTVTGTTGDNGASAEISRILSEKLGEGEDFRVNVRYVEALDPVAAMPTPAECVTDVNAVLSRAKITFAPGSAEIELSSADTVDRIAEIVKTCPDVAMEIGGYTDSQGREEMNQALSQRRAEAVVSALLARRVLTSNLTAFGYGEENPVADNGTEEGREANRRIEFRLVGEARERTPTSPATADNPTIRPLARPEGAEDEGAGDETQGDETADTESADGEAVAEDAGDETGTDTETAESEPDVAAEAGLGDGDAYDAALADAVADADAAADGSGETMEADETAEEVTAEADPAAAESAPDPEADTADASPTDEAYGADPADTAGDTVAAADAEADTAMPAEVLANTAPENASGLASSLPANAAETTLKDAPSGKLLPQVPSDASTEAPEDFAGLAEGANTAGANADAATPASTTPEPGDAEGAQGAADAEAPDMTEARPETEIAMADEAAEAPSIPEDAANDTDDGAAEETTVPEDGEVDPVSLEPEADSETDTAVPAPNADDTATDAEAPDAPVEGEPSQAVPASEADAARETDDAAPDADTEDGPADDTTVPGTDSEPQADGAAEDAEAANALAEAPAAPETDGESATEGAAPEAETGAEPDTEMPAADARDEAGADAETATRTDDETAAAPAQAAGSAPMGTLGLVYGPADAPATRPLRRPPVVVNPDLAEVRPRPRPETIPETTPATAPDAQSPE